MRLGLVTYMMAADWDVDTIIQKCEMLGFEGVELRTTHAHGVEITLDQSQRQDVRKRFEDSGVVLWGLGTTCEYDSPDRAEVEENIRLTKEFVKLAADVGAVGVKVRPNKLHEKEGIPREKTLEQIGLAYRQCGMFAQDFGVELWMEVHGHGTSEPKCIHTIMEVADHENCFVCWNSNLTDRDEQGSIKSNFELLKKWIRSCHITELADKEYPWRELFGLLHQIDYADRFTLAEIQGSSDPERVLKYYRALWEELTQ